MPKDVVFNLKPLTPSDLPSDSSEFTAFLDAHFAAGEKLAGTMDQWSKQPPRPNGVQIVSLNGGNVRKSLGISEFWCGRISTHTPSAVQEEVEKPTEKEGGFSLNPVDLVRTVSKRLSFSSGGRKEKTDAPHNERKRTFEMDDEARQQHIMNLQPTGLYESFRRGLLEYHSENEREYIENCRETSCLQVLMPHVAEIWRLTYVTPPPTSPRTFVILLLSRELKSTPHGERSFMNISIPFSHPSCPEKEGDERSRVRGKYVSVELVTERDNGASVEWRMATSSDAGGSIPRFITNAALPKNVAEDVPSFLTWMWKRFPVRNPLESAFLPGQNGDAPTTTETPEAIAA